MPWPRTTSIGTTVLVAAVAFALAACGGAQPSAKSAAPPAGPTSAAPTTSSAAPSSPPARTTPARTAPARRPADPPAGAEEHAHSPTPTPTKIASTTAAAPPSGPGSALPLGYSTGDAQQVITVVAPSAGATTATLQAWDRTAAGWQPHGGPVPAHIGAQGMNPHPTETTTSTPEGSYTLTQAFGSAANPGTSLPYFRTTAQDWWVSDPNSKVYNTHYQCTSGCPFDTADGENLYQAGYVYTYAVVINYNDAPIVPGGGSAFFLHVTDGSPTAGCVSIPEGNLVAIMQWLDPAKHPRILNGIG